MPTTPWQKSPKWKNPCWQGDSVAQFNSVIELSKLLQQARYQVRGYTYSGKAEAEQPALDAIDNALKNLESLPAQIARAAHRQPATGHRFDQGLSRRGRLSSATRRSTTPRPPRACLTQGDILIDVSKKLTESQTVVRDTDAAHAKNMLIIATLLAVAFGLLAAWAITRQIIIPLNQTLKVAERVAAGDLTHNLVSQRRDELGQLQRSMQSMTQGLRELIGGISDGVTQIASAAEELSAVTEQTSAGVNNQKIETDQVATAMNEMAATVQEVARNAEEASEAAVAADQQAREGDKVVGEAIAQIERLAA